MWTSNDCINWISKEVGRNSILISQVDEVNRSNIKTNTTQQMLLLIGNAICPKKIFYS